MENEPYSPQEPGSNIFTSGLAKVIEIAKAFNERLKEDIAMAQEKPASEIDKKSK